MGDGISVSVEESVKLGRFMVVDVGEDVTCSG